MFASGMSSVQHQNYFCCFCYWQASIFFYMASHKSSFGLCLPEHSRMEDNLSDFSSQFVQAVDKFTAVLLEFIAVMLYIELVCGTKLWKVCVIIMSQDSSVRSYLGVGFGIVTSVDSLNVLPRYCYDSEAEFFSAVLIDRRYVETYRMFCVWLGVFN